MLMLRSKARHLEAGRCCRLADGTNGAAVRTLLFGCPPFSGCSDRSSDFDVESFGGDDSSRTRSVSESGAATYRPGEQSNRLNERACFRESTRD
jgi:hypothetical protein